ncbi:hypothetical protein AeNC1_000459 [Aphanomyces euteiches]|nr:hypothetical protein AeNC1_000459 [Aphanomyces euteiches]
MDHPEPVIPSSNITSTAQHTLQQLTKPPSNLAPLDSVESEMREIALQQQDTSELSCQPGEDQKKAHAVSSGSSRNLLNMEQPIYVDVKSNEAMQPQYTPSQLPKVELGKLSKRRRRTNSETRPTALILAITNPTSDVTVMTVDDYVTVRVHRRSASERSKRAAIHEEGDDDDNTTDEKGARPTENSKHDDGWPTQSSRRPRLRRSGQMDSANALEKMIHPVVARVSSRLLREGPPTSSGPQSTSTAPPIDVEIMPVTDKHGRQLISANDLEKIDASATRRESFRGSTIGLRTPPTEPLPRPRPIKHIPPLAMVEPHVDRPNEPRAQSPEPLALPDITEDALAQLTAQTEMEIQISPPRQDLKALDTYDRDKTLLHHDSLSSSCLSGSLLQSLNHPLLEPPSPTAMFVSTLV